MPRLPDARDRLELEREEVGLTYVAEGPAVPDHRVGLLGLESLTPTEASELVGAEVDRPVGHGSRLESGGEARQPFRHASCELVSSPLVEQRPGMHPVERLEHHQLRAQQSHPVDVERSGPTDL